ncbi:MAG TPA: ABC transporter permease [Planctomycetaceae bacterium]|nr:ABC transporter permease [Planctomycetaceae bacterium]
MLRIALKMLFGDSTKYLGLVLGVAFTTLLVNQQLGIFLGLLSRSGSAISDAVEVDIWVMDPGVETLDVVLPLRETELYRVRGVNGVKWAVPFFRGAGTVRTIDGDVEATTVYGVDDVSLIGVPQGIVVGDIRNLRRPNAVVVDEDGFRRIFPSKEFQTGLEFELNDRRAIVVAVVKASPSFSSGPVLYTRYSEALLFTNNGRNQLSFILAKSDGSRNMLKLRNDICQQIGLKAVTSNEFKRANVQFVIDNTGIPTSFGTVVALGAIVGVCVVGLLTNLFVIENLRQFASLKAIGVRNSRIIKMVFVQTGTAGIVGWAIGLGGAAAFFQFAGQGDPSFRGFYLPWYVATGSAALAFFIMLVASIIGLRRLLFIDPAIVFRG